MPDHSDRLGMRRLSWVQIVLTDDAPRAEVHGVGHRLPCVVPVSVATAVGLAKEGVPLLVSDDHDRMAGAH